MDIDAIIKLIDEMLSDPEAEYDNQKLLALRDHVLGRPVLDISDRVRMEAEHNDTC